MGDKCFYYGPSILPFEYFTDSLRELILQKIIMNWYKLLLINMDDDLFSELEALKDTKALEGHGV